MDMIVALAGRELARAGRDRRMHYGRWALVLWLALVLYFRHAAYYAEWLALGPAGEYGAGATAAFARRLVDFVVAQQTLLVLLVAPSFAAGAVTDEKVRGTLELLFLAHLSPVSVILGKLLARVIQGFVWSLAGWPVIALVGLPGGVAPVFFLALAVTTLLALTGVCAMSLLCSVWTRTTRDAVACAYVVLLGLMAAALAAESAPRRGWEWLASLHPEFVLDAARDEPDYAALGRRLRAAAIGWGGITAACTLVAAWRLRPAYVKQLGRRPLRLFTGLQLRPPIRHRPIAWREQYTSRWPRWIGWLVAFAAAVGGTAAIHALATIVAVTVDQILTWQWVVLFVVSLVAGVRASAAIIAERDRRTWDMLISVPDEFGRIVAEKVEGISAAVWPYWIAAACGVGVTLSVIERPDAEGALLLALALAVGAGVIAVLRRADIPWSPWCGLVLALACAAGSGWFAAYLPFGAALAAVAIRFMTAVGVYISARSTSGWLSLVMTVIVGYLAAALLIGASTPLSCMSCCTITLVAGVAQTLIGANATYLWPYFWALGCALALWWGSVVLTGWTVTWLERRERIPVRFARDLNLAD